MLDESGDHQGQGGNQREARHAADHRERGERLRQHSRGGHGLVEPGVLGDRQPTRR